MGKKNIEACLSPSLFEHHVNSEAVVVVIDTLRATSAICAAFHNGARELIPVGTVEEAREYKEKGYLVAAERDGYILDFADFGNSPFNFTPERVRNNTIVYSTTNGTRTIEMASVCHSVVVGSFLNITALAEWLGKQDRDIILLCAGWKGKVNLEDTFFAGALASRLLESGRFSSDCDSVTISVDLWIAGKDNITAYIDKAAQRSRLREKGLDDCIPYCHEADSTSVIPSFVGGKIIDLSSNSKS